MPSTPSSTGPAASGRTGRGCLTQFLSLVQHHATDTYAEFVVENEELLKSLPPPVVALEYYRGGDLYYFDNFQTSDRTGDPRRPSCRWVHHTLTYLPGSWVDVDEDGPASVYVCMVRLVVASCEFRRPWRRWHLPYYCTFVFD